jgi:hypothetical protein
MMEINREAIRRMIMKAIIVKILLRYSNGVKVVAIVESQK